MLKLSPIKTHETLKISKKAESAGHTLCPLPFGDEDKLQFCNLICLDTFANF